MTAAKIATQALRAICRFRLRSIFMMLGVVVGIASLAIVSSVGENTKRETMQRFKNMLGTFDTVIVRPGGGRSRGMPTLVNVPPTLKFEDASAIAVELPDIKQVALVQNAFDIDVKYRDRTSSPAVFGVSSNWLALRSDEVAGGEFFTPQQDSALARVAVIGTDVQKDLFPGEDPLNKTIRIADVPFEIIGVLKSRGVGPAGASLDNLILVPITTSARRLFNRDYLTMLIAQVRDPDRGDQAAADISRLLRERHQIRPPALDDFTLTNPAATMAQVTRAGSTLARILIGVAVMALLIGAIVIMSLMSIAVAERRKEIGVRRSVGADRASIIFQFRLEAVLVSFSGGILGVLIGFGGMQLVAHLQRLPLVIVWTTVLSAIVLSLLVGVISGIYPAWKASRVDPIQALRS